MSVPYPVILRTGERLETAVPEVTLSTDALPECRIEMTEDPGVRLHELVEVFTAQGSAGIFRVTDRAAAWGDAVSLTMRGALDTLSDDIYPGEGKLEMTAGAALADILSKQTTVRWQLGTCARTDAVKLDYSYTSLLDLAESIRTEKKGYWWVCDYSTTPWTVSLEALPDDIAAEFRLGRNVSSAKVDLSDAELCTKLYMTVSSDSSSTLHVYDNAAAQAEWGVIVRTADVDAEDCPDPDAYGAAILAERAQPIAYITIDGYDLHALTGDDFDRIILGSLCRVSLEGFGGIFRERVTQITWPDAIGRPEEIRTGLSSVVTNFRDQLKLMKKTGGGAKKQAEENERQLRLQRADIDKNNTRIQLWASDAEWNEIAQDYQSTHASAFSVQADGISGIAAGAGVQLDQYGRPVLDPTTGLPVFVNASGNLYSQIKQNKDRIDLKVSAGDVATQLSVEVGNVSISGGNLVVDGMITAADLAAGTITAIDVGSGDISAGTGDIGSLAANTITSGHYMIDDGGSADLIHALAAVQIVANGTNGYKLQYKEMLSSSWTDAGTFNRATLMSGAWDRGILTVLPDAQGTARLDYYLSAGSVTWNGASGSIPILYSTTQGGGTAATGYSVPVSRAGSISAANPSSSQPGGTRLQTVTVGTTGAHAYVRVTSTGYRNASDYIQINY